MSEDASPGERSGSGGPSPDEAASAHEGGRPLAVERPAAGWVELTAPSREEYLDRIASFLDVLAGTRLDEEARDELKFAVTEIAWNAMEWGNCGDERRRVRVSYGLFDHGPQGGELVLKIEDEGEGFDPEAVPDPTVHPAALQRERLAAGKRVGGFGLYVARKLMDRVIYSERGNCVLLTRSLNAKAAESGKDGNHLLR